MTTLTYSFPNLEPVCCSMSSSNYCFLTCIQVSQEAGQGVWYSHLFQNFPQFVVIHTVKGFGIVNKAEIDVFLELSCFFNEPADVGNLSFLIYSTAVFHSRKSFYTSFLCCLCIWILAPLDWNPFQEQWLSLFLLNSPQNTKNQA